MQTGPFFSIRSSLAFCSATELKRVYLESGCGFFCLFFGTKTYSMFLHTVTVTCSLWMYSGG